MRHPYLPLKQRQPRRAAGAPMLMLSGALTSPSHCEEAAPRDSHGAALPPRCSPALPGAPRCSPALPAACASSAGSAGALQRADRVPSVAVADNERPPARAAMDETDVMDLTHQKARKRPRPVGSADESAHAPLKRLPIRASECREPPLMYAMRGEPVPAASLKQNDHSVTSSPNTVMPAQVNA